MQINTPRLTLRPLTDNDRDTLIRMLTHPRVRQTFIVPDYEDAARYNVMFDRLQENSRSDQHFTAGIALGEQLIGLMLDVEKHDTTIEMGYVIHPDHQNCGYATEALQHTVAYLFSQGFDTVQAGAFEQNTSSLRVMEKCGMQPTGASEIIDYRGEQHNCIYLAIQK